MPKHYFRHWGYNSEENKDPSSLKAYFSNGG